jgi:hypothetical protein
VRALAAVVGEPFEERRKIRIRGVRLEADGVAALEVLEVSLVAFELHAFGGSLL